MKMIIKIARTELRTLFYSPVAWFLSVVFLIQCGVFYTYALYKAAKDQDVQIRNNPLWKWGGNLTHIIFFNNDGIINNVLQNLYLFVPLLTMGVISRDINDGTIKLLYSSPVKTRQIVMGKYLAVMLFNVMLLLLLCIFIVTGLINIASADYGTLLSAALGFYLLVCAYTAIGLFMSSLTTYQIVSALGSFIVIFILSRIGGLWQKYDLVRELTYFLSISGRTSKMLGGLITSRDVLYFIIVVYMFIAFTLLRLKGAKEVKPWYVKAGRYLAVLASVLVMGYFSSRPGYVGYWDTTPDNLNTIHSNTQKIIKELGDDPLEVTLYTNLLDMGIYYGTPEKRNNYIWGFWENYIRFKPDIRFKYEYYYDIDDDDSTLYKNMPGKSLKQIAKETAAYFELDPSMFKTPQEMRKEIDLRPEGYRCVMRLKYKGKSTYLRTFPDATFWPMEEQISAAFKRLLQARMPEVLFMTGDLERNIYKNGEREYRKHAIAKEYRYSLLNEGFDADTISLDLRDIPSGIAALVLADPKTKLSDTTMSRLRGYIDKGGNMLINGEPGKQQMLNPLLQSLGIQLMDGNLVQLSKDEMPNMVLPYITKNAIELAQDGSMISLKDRQDSIFQLMPGVAPINYNDSGAYAIKPVVMTSPKKAWLKAGVLVTDSAAPIFNPREGDIRRESFATAVTMTRQVNDRQQRIVVCGDADFMSNVRSRLDYMSMPFYSWLDYNVFPVYTPRPPLKDNMLYITADGASMMKLVYVWILPGLVLLGGTVLLIRRKRQ